MIKNLAILRPKSGLAVKALPFLSDKAWGSIRTVLSFLGGILVTIGVGNIDPQGVNDILGMLDNLFNNLSVLYSDIEVIIGEFSLLISVISSWFSKKDVDEEIEAGVAAKIAQVQSSNKKAKK